MSVQSIVAAAHRLRRAYRMALSDPHDRDALTALPDALLDAFEALDRAIAGEPSPAGEPPYTSWSPNFSAMPAAAGLYGLNRQQRNAIILRAVGASDDAIAGTLGVSVSHARNLVSESYALLGIARDEDGSPNAVQALRLLHGFPARANGEAEPERKPP